MKNYSTLETYADIEHRFACHEPKDDQVQRYIDLRSMAGAFALEITKMCPNSREKSLALMKLEESVMWANAAIARNE